MLTLKEFMNRDTNQTDMFEESVQLQEVQNHEHQADPPNVLVMRRVSIRQFPQGNKVALYYIEALNQYVTVPYSTLGWKSESKKG
jgi:RNA-splicing ligase RtcB